MITVFYSSVDEVEDNALQPYLHTLPVFMRQDIIRYWNIADQKARLLARLMLKESLAREGREGLISEWKKDHHHKPYIESWKPFNISHSEEMVVFSYGDYANGIDIEKMSGINYHEVKHYFHPQEQLAISHSQNAKQMFYQLWSKKEALLKAMGIGIVNGLAEFNCIGEEIRCGGQNWYFRKLSIHNDYMSYLCTSQQDVAITRQRFSLHGLLLPQIAC